MTKISKLVKKIQRYEFQMFKRSGVHSWVLEFKGILKMLNFKFIIITRVSSDSCNITQFQGRRCVFSLEIYFNSDVVVICSPYCWYAPWQKIKFHVYFISLRKKRISWRFHMAPMTSPPPKILLVLKNRLSTLPWKLPKSLFSWTKLRWYIFIILFILNQFFKFQIERNPNKRWLLFLCSTLLT